MVFLEGQTCRVPIRTHHRMRLPCATPTPPTPTTVRGTPLRRSRLVTLGLGLGLCTALVHLDLGYTVRCTRTCTYAVHAVHVRNMDSYCRTSAEYGLGDRVGHGRRSPGVKGPARPHDSECLCLRETVIILQLILQYVRGLICVQQLCGVPRSWATCHGVRQGRWGAPVVSGSLWERTSLGAGDPGQVSSFDRTFSVLHKY